jgi:hypothetical protein
MVLEARVTYGRGSLDCKSLSGWGEGRGGGGQGEYFIPRSIYPHARPPEVPDYIHVYVRNCIVPCTIIT